MAACPLTSNERRAWHDDGFFVRRQQFGAAELVALRESVEQAAAAIALRAPEGAAYALDGHRFVDCGHTTVQFEHQPGSTALRVIEPLAEHHPALAQLLGDERLVVPMQALVGSRQLAHWTDKLNLKRPGEGSGFGWHQDAPYWVHDCAHVARLPNVMLLLDDADTTNGCLRIVRGSHRGGILDGRSDGTQLAGFYTHQRHVDPRQNVAVAAPAGSLVFFSPFVIHGSEPNCSARPRRAYIATYQPGGHPNLKARRVWNLPDLKNSRED